MWKYARPALPVPNGSQPPLCARVSQAPEWNCSQLTALSVTRPASLLDMGFLSGWWSLSLSPSLSFLFLHMHSNLNQKSHQPPKAFLGLLANPSFRMPGLMKRESRGLGRDSGSWSSPCPGQKHVKCFCHSVLWCPQEQEQNMIFKFLPTWSMRIKFEYQEFYKCPSTRFLL